MERFPVPPTPPEVLFTAEVSTRGLHTDPHLLRVARGAFIPLPPEETPAWRWRQLLTLARCAAVVRSHPSALALTHEAAAAVLGLATLRQEPSIDLSVPTARPRSTTSLPVPPAVASRGARGRESFRSREVLLRRSRRVPPAKSVVHVHGLPVTSPLRTAMDCAFDLPVRESVVVVDSALRMVCRPDRFSRRCEGPVDVEEARRRLERMIAAEGTRRGVRRARTAVAIADPFAESPGESVLRWAALATGAGTTQTQVHVVDADLVRHFYLDVALPDLRLDLEFDGYGKLARSEDLHAEKAREMALRRMGWRVERFEWRELWDPDALVRRVRRLAGCDVRAAGEIVDLWR